jgi:hypothetical protein
MNLIFFDSKNGKLGIIKKLTRGSLWDQSGLIRFLTTNLLKMNLHGQLAKIPLLPVRLRLKSCRMAGSALKVGSYRLQKLII